MNIFDHLIPETNAFYVVDRGYIDLPQLHRLHQANSYLATRGKSNLRFQRHYSGLTARTNGIICDHLGVLTRYYSAQD